MDFSVEIEMGEGGSPEVEVRAAFTPSMIEQLSDKVREIDERYGPERDVGPVTLILRHGEFTEVLIGTQKQGDVECYLDEYGVLVEGINNASPTQASGEIDLMPALKVVARSLGGQHRRDTEETVRNVLLDAGYGLCDYPIELQGGRGGHCVACGVYVPRTLGGDLTAHDCGLTPPSNGLPLGICACPTCGSYGLGRFGCWGTTSKPHEHCYAKSIRELIGT